MNFFALLDWRRSIVFALVGPLFAALFVLALSAVQGHPASAVAVAPIVFAWAYAFGVVPAAITGLLVPGVTRLVPPRGRLQPFLQVLSAFLAGTAVNWLCFIAIMPFSAVNMALLGGAGCAASEAAARALRVVPNNSSKPTPLRGAA